MGTVEVTRRWSSEEEEIVKGQSAEGSMCLTESRTGKGIKGRHPRAKPEFALQRSPIGYHGLTQSCISATPTEKQLCS